MTALTLLTVPALPLLLAVAMAFSSAPSWRRLTPWAAVPALWLAVAGTDAPSVTIDWLLLGMELGLDPLGRIFLLLTATCSSCSP